MPLLNQSYTDDKKLKVSANDTTPGYLNGKLTAGTGISLTEGTDGGDETLAVANTDTGSGAVSGHESSYDHTLLHSPVTVLDSTSVDFTLSGQQVTAAVLPAGVDHNSLNNLTTGDPHTQYQKESDFTAGSILFRGASAISEDNTNFFWDNTNKRVGVGTQTPQVNFHVYSTGAGKSSILRAQSVNGLVEWHLKQGANDWRLRADFNDGALKILKDADAILIFSSAKRIGVWTNAPARRFEILDTTNPQERWTHTAGSVYGEVQATSNGYLEFNATGNRILLGKDDSDKTFWGAGYDFSAYYDGTNAYLKTDEVAASDLKLVTGAAKTLELQTVVYEDLNFDPDRSGGSASTRPAEVLINGVYHSEFDDGNDQICGGVEELPHGYKLSSTLYPHVHLFLKASESVGTTGVTFTIYWELRQSTGTTSGSVPFTATSADLGTTAGANKWTINDAVGFAGAAELGAQLALTIARTAGDAGDVIVTTYGVHYAIDTMGSREILSK